MSGKTFEPPLAAPAAARQETGAIQRVVTALAIAMVLIGLLLLYLLTQATNNREMYEENYAQLFTINLVVASVLGIFIAWTAWRLYQRVRQGRFGSRLLFKLAAIFALVGVSPGGEYDFKLRLVARHIAAHIPGQPSIVAQNMTGATGMVMANYLYRVAPKDGTYIGLIQNGLPTSQAVGMEGVQFWTKRKTVTGRWPDGGVGDSASAFVIPTME
jgi:heme/copper-type cytochrome/quinol oxidase subunit 2